MQQGPTAPARAELDVDAVDAAAVDTRRVGGSQSGAHPRALEAVTPRRRPAVLHVFVSRDAALASAVEECYARRGEGLLASSRA